MARISSHELSLKIPMIESCLERGMKWDEIKAVCKCGNDLIHKVSLELYSHSDISKDEFDSFWGILSTEEKEAIVRLSATQSNSNSKWRKSAAIKAKSFFTKLKSEENATNSS